MDMDAIAGIVGLSTLIIFNYLGAAALFYGSCLQEWIMLRFPISHAWSLGHVSRTNNIGCFVCSLLEKAVRVFLSGETNRPSDSGTTDIQSRRHWQDGAISDDRRYSLSSKSGLARIGEACPNANVNDFSGLEQVSIEFFNPDYHGSIHSLFYISVKLSWHGLLETLEIFTSSVEDRIELRPDDRDAIRLQRVNGFDLVDRFRIGVSTGSDDTTKKAKAWIAECQSCHERCGPGEPTKLPKRVIAVEGGQLRLKEPGPEEKDRYACLSYRWGEDHDFLMTRDNLPVFLDGKGFDGLPPTLRDAVTLTQKLGIRYLWIDALCIIQDVRADWEEQASQMASIYENAFLNICAEYSPGVHTGIFSEPTEPDHLLGTFDGTSVYIRLNPHGWKSYELNPLQDRGWTFQESRLSRRCLRFGPQEVSWSCRQTRVICECGHPNNRQHSAMEFHNDEQDPVEKWHRVVSDYAMRKLTYDSDKLPAISGIAKRCLAFRDSDDEYLAGLWRKSLLADLTWCYHDEFYNKQGYADIPYVYCAPSWSWASVVATVTPCFTWSLGSTTRSGEPYRPLCDIHDAKCTLKGLDPMGEVSDGSIDISGPILRATITSNDAESYDFTVNDMEDGLYKELFAPDCFEDKECVPDGTVVECLALGESIGKRRRRLGLLALMRCEEWTETNMVYRRLGFTILKGKRGRVFEWDKANHTRITLV